MTVTDRIEEEAEATAVADPPPPPATPGGLLPAHLVAEREQARLRRRGTRTGAAAAAAGLVHGVRWLAGADAADRGRRYVPAVWTALAVAAVALYLPGEGPSASSTEDLAGAVPLAPVAAPPARGPAVTPTPPAPADGVIVRPAPAPPSVSPRGGTSPSASPAPSGGRAPVAPDGRTPAPTPPASPDDAAAAGLQVREHAWAAPLGDVGVAVTPVPDGALPVAARLGRPEKVSYLRLDGDSTVLELVEDPGGVDESVGEATVQLCAVEDDGWEAGPGQRLDEMPAWGDSCVDGVRAGDRWTFDLTGIGDPAAASGFALVPGEDVNPSFQITFQPGPKG